MRRWRWLQHRHASPAGLRGRLRHASPLLPERIVIPVPHNRTRTNFLFFLSYSASPFATASGSSTFRLPAAQGGPRSTPRTERRGPGGGPRSPSPTPARPRGHEAPPETAAHDNGHTRGACSRQGRPAGLALRTKRRHFSN